MKNILITGANRGIGLKFAEILSANNNIDGVLSSYFFYHQQATPKSQDRFCQYRCNAQVNYYWLPF